MKKTPAHPHRQCKELFARMSEYLDEELDKTRTRILSAHLRHCPACAVCLLTLQRTVALCRALPAATVGKEFSDRLVEVLMRASHDLNVEK